MVQHINIHTQSQRSFATLVLWVGKKGENRMKNNNAVQPTKLMHRYQKGLSIAVSFGHVSLLEFKELLSGEFMNSQTMWNSWMLPCIGHNVVKFVLDAIAVWPPN